MIPSRDERIIHSNRSVTIQNLVRQMRISVFNFVSLAKLQKFGEKQVMGKIWQAKHIPIRVHISWRNPWDRGTADIRQDMPIPSLYRHPPPSHLSHSPWPTKYGSPGHQGNPKRLEKSGDGQDSASEAHSLRTQYVRHDNRRHQARDAYLIFPDVACRNSVASSLYMTSSEQT